MALSEYEQKMLEQLEAQLADEDPKLAESFRPAPTQVSLKNLVFGGLICVLGIAILVGGASAGWSWLGVIGFVVALGGALYATQKAPGQASARPARPSRPGSGASFMERQAQKWDERRDSM